MIHIENVMTLQGDVKNLVLDSNEEIFIDGSGLTILPALIDPHVHFRVPGGEHKEDWKSAAQAAVQSGVTTVFEMPNNVPPCVTLERLEEKKRLIDAQLASVNIPLRYRLYLGADQNHLEEISRLNDENNEAAGIKVFMGCSTGGLVVDSDDALEEVFNRAAERNRIVAVHAEDEKTLERNRKKYAGSLNPAVHSEIRSAECALIATEKAIELSAKYQTPLYLLHMSTKEELELVRQAKKNQIPVFAEVTTHHLFFTVDDYETFGTLVQMNPPLRRYDDQEALWEGIRDGTIDTIGTDHAPHTLEEKMKPYGQAPSGIPGIETLLPLMLDAVSKNKLSLSRLIELSRTNIEKIFKVPPNEDWVLVDLSLEKKILAENLKSKCGWSPYCGRKLRGWPIYTILNGRLFRGSAYKDLREDNN
jgi:dihydroorotase